MFEGAVVDEHPFLDTFVILCHTRTRIFIVKVTQVGFSRYSFCTSAHFKKMNPLETYQLLLSSMKVVFKQTDYEEIYIFKVISRINYSKKTQYTSYVFTRHKPDLGWLIISTASRTKYMSATYSSSTKSSTSRSVLFSATTQI